MPADLHDYGGANVSLIDHADYHPDSHMQNSFGGDVLDEHMEVPLPARQGQAAHDPMDGVKLGSRQGLGFGFPLHAVNRPSPVDMIEHHRGMNEDENTKDKLSGADVLGAGSL